MRKAYAPKCAWAPRFVAIPPATLMWCLNVCSEACLVCKLPGERMAGKVPRVLHMHDMWHQKLHWLEDAPLASRPMCSVRMREKFSSPPPPSSLERCLLISQKNVRNPNHHYFSKKVSQYASNLHCSTPPICIAVLLVPYALRKGNTVSTPPICIAVRLAFVSQYASHLYRSTAGKIVVVLVAGMFPNKTLQTHIACVLFFSQGPSPSDF